MKIKDKMVELKNRGIEFAKEHKDEIIAAGMIFAAEMTFYCIGRRDGKIDRDRDWNETLDGNVIVSNDNMCDWIKHMEDYYGNGDRNFRYFGMSTDDGKPDDIVKVSDLGKISDDMIEAWKSKSDISNERVTHMIIITDPETGK